MCSENKNTSLWSKISTFKILMTMALIDMVPRGKDQREFNKDKASTQER